MCIFNLILMSVRARWEMGKPSLSFKARGRPANTWRGHFRSSEQERTQREPLWFVSPESASSRSEKVCTAELMAGSMLTV